MSKILVTGGMGYIGSHTVVNLIENNYEVIIIDNLSRSGIETLDGIEKTTGIRPVFHQVDLRDKDALERIFEKENNISGVIHFAAFKYVDESVEEPLLYYRNNVVGQLNLLELVKKFKIQNFVFSSSCSVYGNIDTLPVSETTTLNPPQSPYASTKVIGEMLLEEAKLELNIRILSLRYFNPVGAHIDGHIGESPTITPNNVVPRITGVAKGKFEKIMVFGHELPTRDGSCVRDYIHVMDLAEAHTLAIQNLESRTDIHTHDIVNLGSGEGVTVLELIDAFERSTGVSVKKELAPPRLGDVIAVYSDNRKAKELLNWSPKRSIEDMMVSAWNWDKKLP
jgi:UDP-glucose 4-epimerase